MTVRLTWVDNNADETGHQIYRSTTPMDPAALPTPIATVAANITTYEDTDAPADTDCYYRVAAMRDGELAVSVESMINTGTGDGGGGEPVIETDLYWDNVVLLMHLDGANNATTTVDETGKVVQLIGNAVLSTTSPKFGSASALFDGTGDAIKIADSSDWSFGAGDFTIEFQVKHNVSSPVCTYIGSRYGSNGWSFMYFSGYLRVYINASLESQMAWTPAANTWYHLALTREGTTLRYFVNGALLGSDTETLELNRNTTTSNPGLIVGSSYNGSYVDGLNGYMDEVRITKGVCRYTAAFTPPAKAFPNSGPPATDPYWDNVSMLLHMDGVAGATTMVDSSKYARAITIGGNGSLSNTQVKFGSTSFAPSSYVDTTATPELVMGAADFTAEIFLYHTSRTSTGGIQFLFGQDDGSATSGRWFLGITTAGALTHYFNGSSVVSSTITVALNQWCHVAVSRSGGRLRVYLDGVSAIDVADTRNYSAATKFRVGGSDSGAIAITGYVDEFRLTKGVGRYTAAFTPPTKAFPNSGPAVETDPHWDKVVSLLSFDGDLVDKKGKPWTASGSTALSTTNVKFGTGSGVFVRSGGGISTPNHADFDFGSGDFTIEMWINPSDLASPDQVFLTKGEYYDAPFYIRFNPSNIMFALRVAGSSNNVFVTTPINVAPVGVYTHLAFIRTQTQFHVYVNGTSVVSNTVGTTALLTNTAPVKIGESLGGYIDELRITKGVARYTAAFTPPTKAFPIS